MINAGIYPELSNEAYHGDPAISRSGIMQYLQSPFHYWANYINPDRPKRDSTKAMDLGSAFHTLVLEPEKWGDIYSVMPEKKLLRDVGREEYDRNEDEIEATKQNLAKRIILSLKDYNLLIEMNNALLDHAQALDLIRGATYESSFFWEDEHSGLMVKARPDILHSNMIVDLKTCADASPRAFQYAMMDGGYHIQGAMVREGVRQLTGVDIPTVINICIEKKYPYAIGIYIIDEQALEYGYKQFKDTLLALKQDIGHNTFESYPIQTINLPAWKLKNE